VNYIDQAIQDVSVLQAIQKNGFGIGSRFRAKQLNQEVTHSGSVFARLCRMGVLKVAEQGQEKIMVTFTQNVWKDPITETIYTNNIPREIRKRVVRAEVEITKEVVSKFNVYEILVNDENFALQSYQDVMKECQKDVFERMAQVQEKITEIYKGFYKVQSLHWDIEWAVQRRVYEQMRKERNRDCD
jgi:hypothetical protein